MPAGNAALVIRAHVVREASARVEEFEHARARRLHPRVGRLARIAGHRHDTVHEARNIRLDAHVRQRDEIVVVAAPVVGRRHTHRPTTRTAQRVALEFDTPRHTRRVFLKARFHQGEEPKIGQTLFRRLGLARAASYPGHAVDLTEPRWGAWMPCRSSVRGRPVEEGAQIPGRSGVEEPSFPSS